MIFSFKKSNRAGDHAGKILVAMALITLSTTACSNTQQELSEREKDIDKQKEVQMKVVEKTTEELKQDAERQKDQSLQTLEATKKQLDIEKSNIDAQKSSVKENTDVAKKNLDKQEEIAKKVVDRNAQVAKDELKDLARSKP